MPKRKVNEEIAAHIQRLKSRGKKDTEIARELSLDPRTVRSALAKIGKVLDIEHWGAVTREVDSVLLQRHYNILMVLASSLLDQLKRDLSNMTSSHHNFRKQNSIEQALNALFNGKHLRVRGFIFQGSLIASRYTNCLGIGSRPWVIAS